LGTKGEFDNMCTQGLAMGKDVQTDCSVNATIKGKTYCFGNEAAKAEFILRAISRRRRLLLEEASGVSRNTYKKPRLPRAGLLLPDRHPRS
jgi:hypothetical protein